MDFGKSYQNSCFIAGGLKEKIKILGIIDGLETATEQNAFRWLKKNGKGKGDIKAAAKAFDDGWHFALTCLRAQIK